MNPKALIFTRLAQSLKKPLLFLLLSIILQSVLLFININSYDLISGEMSPAQKEAFYYLIIAEAVLFFLLTVIPLVFLLLKKNLSIITHLLLLILPAAYLFVFSVNIYEIVPWQVRALIMPVERILFYQFIFIMPVVFYSILRIASYRSRRSTKKDVLFSAGLLAGPPLLCYLSVNIFHQLLHKIENINHFILPVFLVIATAVVLYAALRLLLILYNVFENKSRFMETIIYLAVGLLMPLGGLILNAFIAFPTDFQSINIYILAILNGIFLAIPNINNKRFAYITAIFRLIFFPFTLYFFIVFLPFLPLSIPAILVFGAGFLLLSPTLLFILHLRRMINDFRTFFHLRESAKHAAVVVSSFLLIPLIIILSATKDKVSINQALTYVYEPDYIANTTFHGNRWFVKHGLESLEKQNSGIYLPFISGFYQWFVFNNLVLPDSKIQYIYKAFFGKSMEYTKRDHSPFSMLLGNTGNNRLQPVSHDFVPSAKVIITDITRSSKENNGFIKTNIKIQMKNLARFQEEFRTDIYIPEGVFVSGYWLHIGKERVPGRIFEKKTAMWIYQMIRSVRQDPGLLYYKNPGLLYLHVFPFSGNENRITEIEFMYPGNISPEITIGTKKLRLSRPGTDRSNIIASQNKDQLSLLLPAKVKTQLPKTTRVPYLHFLVDWSANSIHSNPGILNKIQDTLKKFPEVKYCSITLANYEISNITKGVIPVSDLSMLNKNTIMTALKPRGGFCRDRAIKTILLNYNKQFRNTVPGDTSFLKCPVIFVFKDPDSELLTEDNLVQFKKLAPDTGYYYTGSGSEIMVSDFSGKIHPNIKQIIPGQVIILKLADSIFYTNAGQNEFIYQKTGNKFLSLEVYDPASCGFRLTGPIKYFNNTELYAKGMRADRLAGAKIYNPSLSPDLFRPVVMMSKDTGILNQLTSYIVVENSTQWKMLELKEKEKLSSKESLEIVDSPEPSVFILAGLFFLSLALFRAKKLRK